MIMLTKDGIPMSDTKIATIYARGLDPPHTEGLIQLACSLAKSITLSGWTALVLNFSYTSKSGFIENVTNSVVSSLRCYRVRIPNIPREELLYGPKFTPHVMLASLLESILSPLLIAQEVRARASVAHLVNCFKLPRALFRLIRKTPVIGHACKTPAETTAPFLAQVDAMIVSSHKVAKASEAINSQGFPIFVVYPSVDPLFLQASTPTHRKSKMMLYIGQLARHRVPNELLEIFRQIIVAEPDISFRLIAPVSRNNIARAQEITRTCGHLGIADRVTVLVRDMSVTEKVAEYSAAKCFVFAPNRECGEVIEPPLTILEALTSGLPVLATDLYSANEAVTCGKNEFLVNVNNYPTLVDKAISIMQAEESRWGLWSVESRRFAIENFSMYSMSRRIESVHSTILGS